MSIVDHAAMGCVVLILSGCPGSEAPAPRDASSPVIVDGGAAHDAGAATAEQLDGGQTPPLDAGATRVVDGGQATPTDAGAGEATDGGSAETASIELVVVTLNTHSFQEGPTSVAKLEAIGAGLAALDVDIVGLNEVMSGTFWAYDFEGAVHDGAEIIRSALQSASGQTYNLVADPFATWDTGEVMSNVILCRAEVLQTDSRSLTTTDFWPAPASSRKALFVRADLPGLGPANVFVTHTWGWDSADTLEQVAEVKAFMAEKFVGDEVIDLLLGDLNTPSTSVAADAWRAGPPFLLIDTWTVAGGGDLTPTTLEGTDRIDYVLAGEGWPWTEEAERMSVRRVFDGVEQPVVSDHFGMMTLFTIDVP